MHVIDVVSIEGSGAFLHDVSGSLGFEPYSGFLLEDARRAAGARPHRRSSSSSPTCDERGIRADTHLATGIVANEICEQARTADLVVVGHRGVNERFSTGLLGGTTESVTRKCPKPVLVSPIEFRPVTPPAARLRRQPAGCGRHARGRRAGRGARVCRSPCCTSARTMRPPSACSTRRAVISRPTGSTPSSSTCPATPTRPFSPP